MLENRQQALGSTLFLTPPDLKLNPEMLGHRKSKCRFQEGSIKPQFEKEAMATTGGTHSGRSLSETQSLHLSRMFLTLSRVFAPARPWFPILILIGTLQSQVVVSPSFNQQSGRLLIPYCGHRPR